jgi:hypothetical protein
MTASAASIRRLDLAEIEALRADMAEAGAAMRAELDRRSAGGSAEKPGPAPDPG